MRTHKSKISGISESGGFGEGGRKMGWKLKAAENEFQVTREGKFEYHTFCHGEIYQEIPMGEEEKFEEVES